jgi:hypothetical protein
MATGRKGGKEGRREGGREGRYVPAEGGGVVSKKRERGRTTY